MAIIILKKPKEKKKTDYTFTTTDIIRIFAFNLDRKEQKKLVAFFFFVFPLMVELKFFQNLFAIIKRPTTAVGLYIRIFLLIRRNLDVNFIKWAHLFMPEIDLPFWIKITKQVNKTFN